MVAPGVGRRASATAALLVFAALLGGAPEADAQRRSQADRDRDEAREWYRSGRDALGRNEPEVALASFEQAYALYAHWASMVGMGLAYQAMGQVDQALVCFEQGLADGGDEIPDAERMDIEARVVVLQAQLRPPPPVFPLPPPPPPPPQEEEMDAATAWFWGLLGAAGALGVAAIGTGSYTLVLDREYHDPATLPERRDEIRPTGESLQIATDVMLGLAGAAAIAAVVVLLAGSDDESSDGGVTVTPAGTGLALTLHF
jgi:tetratricopeptide (TPR) repeat protein